MSHLSLQDRQSIVDRSGSGPAIVRQSDLLNITRSNLYYTPAINEHDVTVMNAIDRVYTDYPFYGSRKICHELHTHHGIAICREHVQRLMRAMEIQAIYPKSKREFLSQPSKEHVKYPYLLNHLIITHPNQVWGTDITYVRLTKGFCYLVALIDWYSRYVVAWQLSDTLHEQFCLDNLSRALTIATPDIHNSDQGSHFTSNQYTDILRTNNVRISMDGKGRCMDNIFTERLWRTVKYENIYLRSYETSDQAREGLTDYFTFYNTHRPHQALDYKTPQELYCSKVVEVKKNELVQCVVSIRVESR